MKFGFKQSILYTCLLLLTSPLFSQALTTKQFIKAVQDADVSFYYDENYEEAAIQYEYLLNLYPENSNLSAKLGICYLNLDGKKGEALSLLDKASSNVVLKDKDYVEYGEKAPLDTYLYLAIAYHKNDSIQKAILFFNDARRRLSGTDLFREDYIDLQIKDCRYALEMKKKPMTIVSDLLVPWLKDYPGASNPVISKNDSVFIFTQIKDGVTQILCSYNTGTWIKPVDITKQLGGYDRLFSNSITGDGKLLIIYMDDGGDGNLYFSQRNKDSWSKIKSVGKPINTIYWQSHGFITPDGNEMYFSSNKPGGEGELDIWYSKKLPNGNWGEPVNCGNVINTPYNDDTPHYDYESNALMFSSIGHISMGGYDVFRSVKRNGAWTKPIGLPYTLNNTGENTFFVPADKNQSYITSLYNDITGTRNIYTLRATDSTDNIITADATITLQDGMAVDPGKTVIKLFDQKTGSLLKNISVSDTGSFDLVMKPGNFKILISRIGDKTDTINLNVKKETPEESKQLLDTASFRFTIKPGDYQLFINHIGYKTDTINISIPGKNSGNYISINSSLIPDKVFKGDFLSIKNILFDFDSYKLSSNSTTTLELLKSILLRYPDLKIEVAGFTDSRGSSDYNRNLADQRAQIIIDYLSAKGISASRFVKKVFGSSNFVALNENPDGSDNPDGRKYNRRATIGIINPQTGITIHQETFIPVHLRQSHSAFYNIILLKSGKELNTDYFNKLNIDEHHLIRAVQSDSMSLYVIGIFYDEIDAEVYLRYVKERGFGGAYIVTQFDLRNTSKTFIDRNINTDQSNTKNIITIQLAASILKLSLTRFKSIEGVKEIYLNDGFYRYIIGDYKSFAEARNALVSVKAAGFEEAYVRELNLPVNK